MFILNFNYSQPIAVGGKQENKDNKRVIKSKI